MASQTQRMGGRMMTQRSPEEEAIYQRVREEIAETIEDFFPPTLCPLDTVRLTDQILAIKLGSRTLRELIELYEKGKLAILADDQSVPTALYHREEKLDPEWVEEAVQQDMLQAGFRKVIKLEDD